MKLDIELERLGALSDRDLLSSLGVSLQANRRSTVVVIAHLCEVEERRLHWLAGYPSLFAYCVSRLGMSEDEAYRRIEAARLCRRHPRVFEKLAGGQLSLSVAVLLKQRLTAGNDEHLL